MSLSLIDLNAVAEKITDALNAHYEAVKRLSTGKGNALSIGERIRNLGVKTKRQMPSMLVDGVSITAAEGDSEAGNSTETDGEMAAGMGGLNSSASVRLLGSVVPFNRFSPPQR